MKILKNIVNFFILWIEQHHEFERWNATNYKKVTRQYKTGKGPL